MRPGVQVEDELSLREPGHTGEERGAVAATTVFRAIYYAGDRPAGVVVVQVAQLDGGTVPEPAPGGVHHRGLGVHAGVAQPAVEQEGADPPVAAREVEHLVPRLERDAEGRDQLRAVVEVCVRIRVLGIGPPFGLAGVLIRLVAHKRASVSGCRRTNRAMLRACHHVWREPNPLSVTCAQSCVTCAAGTYQRSHRARIAR